ncbi:MAG: anaerobic ribonucleoside-triphosphate reductase activating protein [Ruminococcaceae bacterium]|nr:anaerobic ribonucleoside-triphosphate reductase activating protein [Oscillospiraceae bacterium]
MSELMLCGIESESIVDGPGFRYVIFTQGCPHNCKGCHNPQTHPFEGGFKADIDLILSAFDENPLLCGITFSGGEPFCQASELLPLARAVRAKNKGVMSYSGYTLEELLKLSEENPDIMELLKLCDLLVDGRYVEEQRDLTLRFRGSRNQRVINMGEYFKTGEIKLYE